jgi:uncharacterized protein YkwD
MNFRFPLLIAMLVTVAARADDLALRVLDEINLARTQPQQYAQILARQADASPTALEAIAFLQKVRPLPPLSWSQGISRAALSHALDIGPRGGSGHTGARGETPWKRMARFGTWQGYAGENIDYGHGDPRAIVASLIIDRGVSSRLHRANLFNRAFRVAGIAVGPHAAAGTMCVMDFAGRYMEAGEERVASRGSGVPRSIYSGMSFF